MLASRGALGRHVRGLLGRLGDLFGSLRRIVGRWRPPEGVLGVFRARLGPPGRPSKGSPRAFDAAQRVRRAPELAFVVGAPALGPPGPLPRYMYTSAVVTCSLVRNV